MHDHAPRATARGRRFRLPRTWKGRLGCAGVAFGVWFGYMLLVGLVGSYELATLIVVLAVLVWFARRDDTPLGRWWGTRRRRRRTSRDVAARNMLDAREAVARVYRLRVDQQDGFTCPRCGGLRSFIAAMATLGERVAREMAVDMAAWIGILSDWRATRGPLRPASVQRTLGVSFDEATAFLGQATRRGLLVQGRSGLAVAPLVCSDCPAATTVVEPVAMTTTTTTASREPIPAKLRFSVLQRDRFSCQYCGDTQQDGAKLHLDHIVPVAQGGATTAENLITACDRCNLGKGTASVLGDEVRTR